MYKLIQCNSITTQNARKICCILHKLLTHTLPHIETHTHVVCVWMCLCVYVYVMHGRDALKKCVCLNKVECMYSCRWRSQPST